VVQSDSVEAIFNGNVTLNLVSLNGGSKDLLNSQRRLAIGYICSREPICYGQDGTQVVRRVSPFLGEPGVVEVEPSDKSSVVEGGSDRVKLVIGSRDLEVA
jgi:hypothetical protein